MKEMRQELISKTLMKRCLSNIVHLPKKKKEIKPLPPEPELSAFFHPSETQKKWRTIICCSGYRHCNICPIQIP